jgi:prepilin-type N-terminal cleavage/methylation domain-containing protein
MYAASPVRLRRIPSAGDTNDTLCPGGLISSNRGGRSGFTLIEVIVAAAIIATLSAIMFPVVAEQIERRRVDNAVTTLKNLADAVTAFRVDVGMNPGRLVDLSSPITSMDLNSCGSSYGTPAANLWAGPYYTKQLLISTGLPLSEDNLGRVQNVLPRDPAGLSTPGTLAFQVTSIPVEKVTEIDDAVDGDGGVTTGRVRWTTPADANGHVTMSYHVAINGC